MTTVNITLQADFTVTDDGGDYEDKVCANMNQGNNELADRKRHYKSKYKRQGRGDRTERDQVNVRNLAGGGTLSVSPVQKENA
jgi:hypothetical protein